MNNSATKNRRASRYTLSLEVITAVVAVCIGIWLRVGFLEAQGLWHDEFYTAGIVAGYDLYLFDGSDMRSEESARHAGFYQEKFRENKFLENWGRNIIHEGHPPTYYLASWAWTSLFSRSPLALRGFSALCSVLLLGVLVAAAIELNGRNGGLHMALLASASPFLCYFAGEARSYSLALLLVAITVWITVRWVQRPDASWATFLGFGAFGALSLYTHYYAAPAVLILSSIVILFAPRPSAARKILWTALPFLSFLPWLPVLYKQTKAHSGHWTEVSLPLLDSIGAALSTLASLLANPIAAADIFEIGATALVLLISAAGLSLRRAPRPRILMFTGLASVVAFLAIVMTIDLITDHHTIAIPRYSFALVPFVLLLIASGICELRSYSLAISAAIALAGFLISLQLVSGERLPRQMLREAATYLSQESEPTDLILVSPAGPTSAGLSYYLPPGTIVAATPIEMRIEVASSVANEGRVAWLVTQNLGDRYLPSTPNRTSIDSQSEILQPPLFSGIAIERYPPGSSR